MIDIPHIARHFIYHNITQPEFIDPLFECDHELYQQVLLQIEEYTAYTNTIIENNHE